MRVAIVGAGFSGTMLAVHLASRGAVVTLIDRRGRFGAGLAYSTTEPVHLLNVPAGKMSAFVDTPDHFAQWLRGGKLGGEATFARRIDYRAYLAEIWETGGSSVRRVEGEAIAVEGTTVRLASGAKLEADAVVIAAGNLPAAASPQWAAGTVPYVADPWSDEGHDTLCRLAAGGSEIVILGTGLTMIDTVLTLHAHGFGGSVLALSRRGLLPRAHDGTPPSAVPSPTDRTPPGLLRWAREQTGTSPWRAVIDSLRPITAAIWQGWSLAERGRFLRHLRPWWDVHRHRIAPQVGEKLAALQAEGRLVVAAGRIAGFDSEQVMIRRRGSAEAELRQCAGIVNCTGPQGDIRRSTNKLIRSLLDTGAARADPLGLGLDVDRDARVLGPSGAPTPGLYAIGPMTKGAFWEIIAVPDIRGQAQELASRIVADFAVEPRAKTGRAA